MKWRRADDEVESAKILLEESIGKDKSLYQTLEIDLPEIDGFRALGFSLPCPLRVFAGRIRELAMDSACE